MSYVPRTDWQDGLTPVHDGDLTRIEQGIASKADQADLTALADAVGRKADGTNVYTQAQADARFPDLGSFTDLSSRVTNLEVNGAGASAGVVAGKVDKSANLSDLASVAAARTNLGLGDAATHPASDFGAATDVTANTTAIALRTPDLTDSVQAGSAVTAAIGQRTLASTAGATITAPAPGAATTPPQRFSVRNTSAGTQTMSYKDSTGTTQNLTLLPGETLTLRQSGTLGYFAESGNKTLSSLDGRYATTTQGAKADAAVAKGSQFASVADFGADATFATDSTAAFRNAIASLSVGGTLLIPPGKYRITGQINVTKSITVAGTAMGDDGNSVGSVLIVPAAFSGSVFSVSAANSVTFRDFNLTCYDTAANLTAAPLTAVAFTTGRGHAIQRCRISNFYINVDFQNCDFWILSESQIVKAVLYGVKIANAANPDSGDSFVHNCWIGGNTSGSFVTTALIRQESGGGTKFTGNKIIGGGIGYQLAIPDGVVTSVSLFANNSFEGQTVSCVDAILLGPSNTGAWARISFTGNEFLGNLCTQDIVRFHPSIAGQLQQLSFVGNTIAGAVGVNSLFIDGVSDFTVTGNTINGGVNGILLGSLCRDWKVRANHISAVTGSFIKNAAYYQWQWTDSTECEIERTRYVFSTSTSTPFNVAALSLPNTGGFMLEVVFSGQVSSGTTPGGVAGFFQRLVTVPANGGTLALTTVGTDTTSGPPFTLNFTVSGNTLTISMQRSASDGGATALQGTCYVKVKGSAYSV